MSERLNELKARWRDIYDLNMAAALLRWDMSTYMPRGGAEARSRQVALLSGLGHDRLVDPAVGKLLDELEKEADKLDYDSDDAAIIRVARRDYDQARKIPSDLIAEMENHFSLTYTEWTKARPANDFAAVRPLLEKTLDLSRRLADCFQPYDDVADPLIAFSDFGMKTSDIRRIFGGLRNRLVPLVRAIASRPLPDDACLALDISEDRQLAFGLDVIRKYGYDFDRGRQDMTAHPFMTKFSLGDIRITTRTKESNITDSLFSTLHESGHAMYEQGIRMEYEGTPLATGTSSGVHESQSRLWENQVGRGRDFWSHFYGPLQEAYPELKGVDDETFFRAINRVERSRIRTESDEVTYNLHIMIRFDLEVELLEGRLKIKDLPEAWNARYKEDLDVDNPEDVDGVLQDVHWHSGPIGGAFQGYTLGNIMAAQFFAKAKEAHPDIPEHIRGGKFDVLRGWLTDNIYQHGAKYTADELVKRVTGDDLTIDPYMDYLWDKFQPLYDLKEDERSAGVEAG